MTPVATVAPSFRQNVTALRVTIVPSKTSRSHECGVATDTGGGTTTILDENGEETELSGDEGTEGAEICLITRGKKGGGKETTGSADPGSVDDRLAQKKRRWPRNSPRSGLKLMPGEMSTWRGRSTTRRKTKRAGSGSQRQEGQPGLRFWRFIRWRRRQEVIHSTS